MYSLTNPCGNLLLYFTGRITTKYAMKTMKNQVRIWVLATLLSPTLFSACTATATTQVPRARVDVIPAAPSARHVWIPGHYVRRGRNYIWVNGFYRAIRPGHRVTGSNPAGDRFGSRAIGDNRKTRLKGLLSKWTMMLDVSLFIAHLLLVHERTYRLLATSR